MTFKNLAQKVSDIALLGSGCKVSMEHIFQRGRNDQIYNLGLKIVIFGLFQSPPLRGEIILNFKTWLKMSPVLPPWSQGAKLA